MLHVTTIAGMLGCTHILMHAIAHATCNRPRPYGLRLPLHHSTNFHENRRLNCMLTFVTFEDVYNGEFLILRNNRNPSTSIRHCRASRRTYA